MGGRGLVVLGINDEKGFAARNFLQNHNLTLRTLADPKHAVHKLYGVHSIPTLEVVDRQGTVVSHFHRAVPEDVIRGSLKQAGLQETADYATCEKEGMTCPRRQRRRPVTTCDPAW